MGLYISRSPHNLLPRALEQILDKDPFVASAAQVIIKDSGTNAIPLLLARLKHVDIPWIGRANSIFRCLRRDPSVELIKSAETKRSEAVKAFSSLGEVAAPYLPELFQLRTKSNTRKRSDAPVRVAECIAAAGPAAKPWLVKGLGHSDAEIRNASITMICLHFEGAVELCPYVIPLSTDPEAEIRELAIFFLVTTCSGSEKLRELLLREVHDPDAHIRR